MQLPQASWKEWSEVEYIIRLSISLVLVRGFQITDCCHTLFADHFQRWWLGTVFDRLEKSWRAGPCSEYKEPMSNFLFERQSDVAVTECRHGSRQFRIRALAASWATPSIGPLTPNILYILKRQILTTMNLYRGEQWALPIEHTCQDAPSGRVRQAGRISFTILSLTHHLITLEGVAKVFDIFCTVCMQQHAILLDRVWEMPNGLRTTGKPEVLSSFQVDAMMWSDVACGYVIVASVRKLKILGNICLPLIATTFQRFLIGSLSKDFKYPTCSSPMADDACSPTVDSSSCVDENEDLQSKRGKKLFWLRSLRGKLIEYKNL